MPFQPLTGAVFGAAVFSGSGVAVFGVPTGLVECFRPILQNAEQARLPLPKTCPQNAPQATPRAIGRGGVAVCPRRGSRSLYGAHRRLQARKKHESATGAQRKAHGHAEAFPLPQRKGSAERAGTKHPPTAGHVTSAFRLARPAGCPDIEAAYKKAKADRQDLFCHHMANHAQ